MLRATTPITGRYRRAIPVQQLIGPYQSQLERGGEIPANGATVI